MIFYTEFIPVLDNYAFELENPENYIVKLTLRGNINLEKAAEFSMYAKVILAGGVKNLMLNLEHLAFIDSSGIGSLIRIKKTLKAIGGNFVLLNVPPKIKEAFDLINLKDIIPIFLSEEKALAHIREAIAGLNKGE
jgi:anti-anti-sigma factor